MDCDRSGRGLVRDAPFRFGNADRTTRGEYGGLITCKEQNSYSLVKAVEVRRVKGGIQANEDKLRLRGDTLEAAHKSHHQNHKGNQERGQHNQHGFGVEVAIRG